MSHVHESLSRFTAETGGTPVGTLHAKDGGFFLSIILTISADGTAGTKTNADRAPGQSLLDVSLFGFSDEMTTVIIRLSRQGLSATSVRRYHAVCSPALNQGVR